MTAAMTQVPVPTATKNAERILSDDVSADIK